MSRHNFEVSERFYRSVETRIAQLEANADADERIVPELLSPDHQRRQRKLVAAQRYEASRMRELLGYARLRRRSRASLIA